MIYSRHLRDAARTLLGPIMEAAVGLRYALFPYQAVENAWDVEQPPQSVPPETVDVVYTWVDGSDENWLKKKELYAKREQSPIAHFGSSHQSRFHSRDELKYSLRSLFLYAKYVRNIYIVTDHQVPAWLNVQHPQIHVVDHEEIFHNREVLPTFNAHAIETSLHRIPGLDEHYLYLNDDFFFGRHTRYTDFFTGDGRAVVYLSPDTVKETPADEKDSSEVWATQNDRALILEVFGRPLEHKVLHVPYSQLKSVLYELESRFSREFADTAGHRFRSMQDIKVPCSLFPYYGYYTNKVKFVLPDEAPVFNKYVNVASPFLRPVLKELLITRKFATFCINEPISSDFDTSVFDKLLHDFLDAYYPDKSPFEL